ncbi:MAG: NHL repeat-containing protein [Armatimonadetes bacterium]|nr:NHL repeat-containing protein [Armatimonadota bacterium]
MIEKLVRGDRSRWRIRSAVALVVALLFVSIGTGLLAKSLPKIKENVCLISYGWSRSEKLKSPGGVFFYARKGEIYVADTGNHQILIFNEAGTPIVRIRHSVDGKEPGTSRQGEPKQVAVNSRGDIYVVDSLARYLDVLDYRGRSIERIYPGDLLDMQRDDVRCAAVTVDSADNVYIGVSGEQSAVLVLDRKHSLIRRIGEKGDGDGKFKAITGIWIDGAGKIYVSDARNEPAVQVFSPEGKLLVKFGVHETGPHNFSLPSGVVTDEFGNIYVTDSLRHWIGAFTSEGKFIIRLAGGFGTRPGDLSFPTGIASDGKRTIYTVEKAGARLQGFKLEITQLEKD